MPDDRSDWDRMDTHAKRISAARKLLTAAKESRTRGRSTSMQEDEALELVGRAFGVKMTPHK